MPAMSASKLHTTGRRGSTDRFDSLQAGGASPARPLRSWGPALAGFGVPFVLILYLSLREGGYEQVARSEMGVVIWLVVLLGSIAGLLPLARLSRTAWIGIGLFVALAIWTGVAAIWSESAERTAIEAARVATLLAAFVLALCLQRNDTLRRTVAAVGAAVALVALLALASRLLPGLFPENDVTEALPTEQARLGYPLDYWNGLATMTAMGMPLLLYGASSARSVGVRALACAALPILALVSFFTLSRGGVLEAAVGLSALVLLMPRRLRLVGPGALAGAAAALLIVLANARTELSDGLETEVAQDQGVELLLITLAVVVAVGGLNYLLQSGLQSGRWRLPAIGPRRGRRLLGATALVGATVAIAAGAPGQLSSSWQTFKEPSTPSGDKSRFTDASGSGRYQWWSAAAEAGWSAPLAGIGPGTFEFWWARDDVEIVGFVRDAHSLYLESFAELGVPGLLLVVALAGGAVAIGVVRARAPGEKEERLGLAAAATAAVVAFVVAAAIDWAWELTVLPVTALFLVAALIGPSPPRGPGGSDRSPFVLPALAAVSLLLIVPPMLSRIYLNDSQAAAAEERLVDAVVDARNAQSVLPFAASPHIQKALVYQLAGALDAAAEEARLATEAEPTNWRTWLVLSRTEADRGESLAAEEALERSRELNPRSLLFQEPPEPTG